MTQHRHLMENTTGSQIPCSLSHSLSLPSEPPDVRNWFPRYKYESFVLDTDDDVKCPVFDKTSCEMDGFVDAVERTNRESTTIDGDSADSFNNDGDKHQHQRSSEIPDSLFSESLSSEPPDIRNWFSSYTYESPEVGGDDAIFHTEVENGKDEFVNDGNIEEKEVGWRNFGRRGENDVIVKEKQRTSELETSINFSGNNQQKIEASDEYHNYVEKENDSTTLDNLCWRTKSHCKRSNHSMRKDTTPNHGSNSTKDTKNLNWPNEGSLREHKQEQYHLNEAKVNTRPGSDSTTPTRPHLAEKSPRRSGRGNNDKENGGKQVPDDGFVTTRKKSRIIGTNDENCSNRTKGSLHEFSMNRRTIPSSCTEKGPNIKRIVLSETTNVKLPELVEVTGKWRCPMKTKPNLGPPLKQLRLEQWVRRS